MNRKAIPLIFIPFFILFTSGCSNSVKNVNDSVKIDQAPKYQIPKQIEQPKPRAKGSLYGNRGGSLFTDRKDLQLGDIVYVKIDEGTTGGDGRVAETVSTVKQNQNENSREITALGVTPNEESPGIIKSIINGINGILGIGMTTGDSTSAFDVSAESTMEDEFVNDIAAVVTKAYQNGNYFIVGEKNIVIKGQQITIKLSGVMNPENLDTTSTIKSNRIANLKTLVYKTGSEADLEEKPWGTKVLDTISPF